MVLHKRDIILIDDKAYGMSQLKNAVPANDQNQFRFLYFESFKKYNEEYLSNRDTHSNNPFIVFLDFFLKNDRSFGTDFLEKLGSEVIVGFSSMKGMSDLIKEECQKKGIKARFFSVEKKRGINNTSVTNLIRQLIQSELPVGG